MMGAAPKLTDDDIKAIADAVLGSEMADLGFEGVEVRHREIYPDEPSLFIRAKVAEEVPAPFDAKRFGRLRGVLHNALLARGEERFPHFSLNRAGDVPPDVDAILGEL